MREIVGSVTNNEKEEIKRLDFREKALNELIIAINDNKIDFGTVTKERVSKDMQICKNEKAKWWNNIYKKYNLYLYKYVFVDFITNELYIDV